MNAIFEMRLTSDIPHAEDLSKITGCARRGDQIEWLTGNGWISHKNKANNPIAGCMSARLKMTGLNPVVMTPKRWMGARL